MELKVLKDVEKQMNLIMFIANIAIPIIAFAFVMIFIEGTWDDAIVLIMVLIALLVKAFEKPLGKYAKYIYVSNMAIVGPIIIVYANDGKFAAITQAYFLYLILSVAYYNKSVVIVNAVTTVVMNLVGLVLFLDPFLLMHNVPFWIFIMSVFMLAVATAIYISTHAYNLFYKLDVKEKNANDIVLNVTHSLNNLKVSSDDIYSTLDGFSNASHKIADYSREIADSSIVQTNEVDRNLNMCNELAERITSSEEKVSKTVGYMEVLRENNNIGMSSIKELSEKFSETTESSESASREIANLSEKSESISGIIQVISNIANQTNLLSLNAAIEAARAGESGKGFAVVAGEIKQLAQQSSDSTQQIAQILTDITNIVEETKKTLDNNKFIVKESNDKLNITVKVFDNIVESSKQVVDITNVLDKELKSIKVVKDQLLDSMDKLYNISEHSVTSTKDVSASAEAQVVSIDNILKSMESIQNSINSLTTIMNDENEI